MFVEQKIFFEPFCYKAEPKYFQYLVHRVIAQNNRGIHVKIPVHTIFDTKGNVFTGHVVWKTSNYGEETGLCISGESAGYLVTNGPLRVDVGRVIAIDGAGFYGNIAQEAILDAHNLEKGLDKKLRDIIVSDKDGVLAEALVVLLSELSYPVDADRFMDNVWQAGLRWYVLSPE